MKQIFAFLAGSLILFSSCSSTNKVAQTPDDIYYSPDSRGEAAASSENNNNRDEYYSTSPSDNYVRLKAHDPRWSQFDDYNAYDSYYAPVGMSAYYGSGFGYPYYGFGLGYSALSFGFWNPYSCWNSYYMWNSWYNPYFYNPYYGAGVVVVKSGSYYNGGSYNHLQPFNGATYRTVSGASSGGGGGRFYRPVSGTQSYSPGRLSGSGNTYRPVGGNNNPVYRPNSGSYRPAYNPPSQPVFRSYSPPPSMGSGGGGGGGVSRPGRH